MYTIEEIHPDDYSDLFKFNADEILVHLKDPNTQPRRVTLVVQAQVGYKPFSAGCMILQNNYYMVNYVDDIGRGIKDKSFGSL